MIAALISHSVVAVVALAIGFVWGCISEIRYWREQMQQQPGGWKDREY